MKRFGSALFAVMLLAGITRAMAAMSPDPGLASLAVRLAEATTTVPFEGSLRKYRGYMFETGGADFKSAYKSAIHKGIPSGVLAANDWIAKFDGVMIPNELIEWSGGKTIYAHLCKAHECPDHTVYAFFDPQKNLLWGVLNLEKKAYVFGDPSGRQEALVYLTLGREAVQAETFPVTGNAGSRMRKMLVQNDGDFDAMLDAVDRSLIGG